MMNTEYILYLGQEGNFQTRSMLIPAKEFLESRSDTYDLLKKYSSKNYKFVIDGVDHIVDNLLVINYIYKDGIGKADQTEYNQICHQLTSYADGMDNDHYFDMRDKIWYDNAIINLCSGFNHIKNYHQCKAELMAKYKIIDSFLVLES